MAIDFENPEVRKRLIRLLIENTPVAYIVLDKEYRVQFINDFFLKFRKLEKEKVMGQHCYSISNGGVPCAQCAVRQSIETGEKVQILRKDTLPDGTVRYMDDISIPLRKNKRSKKFDYLLEIMINRTKEKLLQEKTQELFLRVVDLLVATLEEKDFYTSTHSRDVSRIAAKLASYMGMSDDEIFVIELAGLLHDIGKVYVSYDIINKTSKLDDDEFKEIQKHPAGTAKLLEGLGSFAIIKDISASHHEKWNGFGYPNRVAGENIPYGARILAIADTYDAMTSTRSYRKALDHAVALEEIKNNAGTQFDPELAMAFVKMAEEVYLSRDALTAKDLSKKTRNCSACVDVERKIKKQKKNSKSPAESMDEKRGVDDLLNDDFFIEQIYANTPAYYTVIDEQFNVLYVSDSIERDLKIPRKKLLTMRCFEVNNKNMKCFAVKNGVLACPSVRAFQTGTVQTGNVVEDAGDDKMYFDIFSVPTQFETKSGEVKRCVVEILFDRTNETKLQLAIEKDIRHVVDLLTEISGYVDPGSAENLSSMSEGYCSLDRYLQDVEQLVQLG